MNSLTSNLRQVAAPWSSCVRREAVAPGGQRRVEAFDLAKGLAMTYVLLTHTLLLSFPHLLGNWALALFFLVSGLFFRECLSFSEFLTRNFKRIFVPAAIFMIFGFCIRLLALSDFSVGSFWADMPPKFSFALDYFVMHTNTPIWFLFSLFIAECLWWMVAHSFRSLAARAVCLVALAGAGLAFSLNVIPKHLPLWACTSLLLLPLYALGHFIAPLLGRMAARRRLLIVTGVIMVVTGALIAFGSGSYLRPYWSEIRGDFMFAYASAFLLCGGSLMLCMAVRWLPFVSFIGRNSLAVLGVHLPVIHCLGDVMAEHTIVGSAAVMLLSIVLVPAASSVVKWASDAVTRRAVASRPV